MNTQTILGALVAGACLLSGCTTQRATLEVGDPELVPVPRTLPPANSAVKYIRQQGDWYQLRVSLDSTHPKLRPSGISYSMDFESVVTVRKYKRLAMKSRSIVLLAVLSLTCLLSGCGAFSVALSDQNATVPPVPRTAPDENTEVSYVRQKGHWYQLRLELKETGPKTWDRDNGYSMHFKARASVWKYNRKTGEYETVAHQGYSGPGAHQGLSFRFAGGDDSKLHMTSTNGGGGGGSAGWPNGNFTETQITVDPVLYGTAQSTTDEMDFAVISKVTVKPTARELKKNANLVPLVLEARQNWRVKVLAPAKKARFTRLE